MSSWDPSEKKKTESSHAPGVKGKEVLDNRDFPDSPSDFDKIDYIVIGMVLSIPAGFLTVLLLWEFFPQFQDRAGDIIRELGELLPLVHSSMEPIWRIY